MEEASKTGYIEDFKAGHIRGEDNPTELTAHVIFEWIGFRPRGETRRRNKPFPVRRDAHLLSEPVDEDNLNDFTVPHPYEKSSTTFDVADNNAREYLVRHPLVARSFATSIPVDSISFCYVHNHDLPVPLREPDSSAVTVTHVLQILHQECVHL